MSDLLATSVDELDVPLRVYNCLLNLNIKTVGDLMQRSEVELMRCPNFGDVSLRDLKSALEVLGLELPRQDSSLSGYLRDPVSPSKLPDYINHEIDRATAQFRSRRIGIETRRWEQAQSKKLRDKRKKTASEQAIATAENRARFRERDRIVVLLREAGATFKWIGKVLSISGGRVSTIYFVTKRRQDYAKRRLLETKDG